MVQLLVEKIFVLFFSVISFSFSLQENSIAKDEKTLPIKVLKITNSTQSFKQLLENTNELKPQEFFFEEKTNPSYFYWLQIDFKKELGILGENETWFLNFKSFEYGSVYMLNNNGDIIEDKIGVIDKNTIHQSWLPSTNIQLNQNSLINNRYLYLKVKRTSFFEKINSWKFNYITQKAQDNLIQKYSWETKKTFVPVILFAGVLIIMFILTLAFFIQLKQFQFLCYASYVLWLFLFLCGRDLEVSQFIFGKNQLIYYWFFQILQVLMNISYVAFIMYYLNTKDDYKKLHKAIKVIITVLVLMLISSSILIALGKFSAHLHLMNFHRLMMFLFGICSIIYLLKNSKNRLTYFIVFGSLFYMLGSLGFIFLRSYNLMLSGVFLEVTIFAFGLTYKMQQEHRQRIRFQQEAFTNKAKALRAQINPHFIFNSLSSIQHLITSNNKAASIKYLSKFSRLTRNILESSIETNVVLDDEIKMLNDYLELESLRFDNAFSYKINIDENVETDFVEVPFMILQPFVENAIIHGLLPKKEGEKRLTINFKREGDIIICEIDDNGVGRQKAKEKIHIHKKEKKSRGLEVTLQRLETLSGNDNKLQIIDKFGKDNNASGTTVIIRFAIE